LLLLLVSQTEIDGKVVAQSRYAVETTKLRGLLCTASYDDRMSRTEP
jgi:hypothetical protein